ncbi:MAG: MG2 domain-containing protein [bacterium]
MGRAAARTRALIFGTLLGCVAAAVAYPTPGTAWARAEAEPFRLDLTAARARLHQGWLEVRTPWKGAEAKRPVTLRLLDLRDRVLSQATLRLGAVPLPDPRPGPRSGKLPRVLLFRLRVPAGARGQLDLLRVSQAGRPSAVAALSEIGEMPFLWLRGQSELTAGSQAALRVIVRDLKSRPLEGVRVTIRMTAAGQTLLAQGLSDGLGSLQKGFTIPAAWAGRSAQVVISARTDVFLRTLRQEVTIRRTTQALLRTDKPIYQPGQTVHLRLLALRQPSRKPLENARVRFTAVDGRGNKIFRAEGKTDEYGVAWTRVTLSGGFNPGTLTLRARVWTDAKHWADSQATVKVFRYRLPTFSVKILADRTYYRPGAKLHATLEARYLHGKPVPGARVTVTAKTHGRLLEGPPGRRYRRIYEMESQTFATVRGRTDKQGRLRISATIPRRFAPRILLGGGAQVHMSAQVSEPGGSRRNKIVRLPVSRHDVLIAALPEAGKLVPGLPQRLYLVAAHPDGTPAPGRIDVRYWERGADGTRGRARHQRLRTDDHGFASLVVTPGDRNLWLSLTARDRQGRRGAQSVGLETSSDRVLVRPDRAVHLAGDTVRLTVWSRQKQGHVYLDIKHRDQTVKTWAARLRDGKATVAVPLHRRVDGLLSVVARIGSDEGWAPIFVQPARRLTVQLRTDRQTYRPGQTARLALRVTDEKGQGRRAALGLTVVDEAVYLLAGEPPRTGEPELLLEHGARPAGVSLNGWTPLRVLQDPKAIRRQHAAGAVLALLRATGFSVAGDSVVRSGTEAFPGYRQGVRKRLGQRLRAYFRARFDAFRKAQLHWWRWRHRHVLLCPGEAPKLDAPGSLAQSSNLKPAELTDLWGTPLRWELVAHYRFPEHYRVRLLSAGPDAAWQTEDDLTAGPYVLAIPTLPRKRYCGYSSSRYSIGHYRARSPRVFMSRASVTGANPYGAMPTWSTRQAEPRVRKDFRETLAVLPALRTDAEGRAAVRLKLADNITRWVVSALASGRSGRLGGALLRFRVFQPFFTDVRLPPLLTRLDEVEVPVVVHNYLKRTQTVRLQVSGSAALQVLRGLRMGYRLIPGPAGPRLQQTLPTDNRTQVLLIPPGGVMRTSVRIRALRVGRATLTVKAYAGTTADAVQRTVQVLPEGREARRGGSGILIGPVAQTVTLPAGFVPDSQRLQVTVEPGLLAMAQGSFDGLLQRPYGCFEQSSAITYPNILVLRHLRQERRHRQQRARAAQFVREGYQKLLGFEVQGGGFSLYGDAPAGLSYTALGLAQLTELSAVRYVDPQVVLRARQWLVKRQGASGSWKVGSSPYEGRNDELALRYTTTAYVAWKLAETGLRGKPLDAALDFLRTHLFVARDNSYALALAANAVAAAKLKKYQPFLEVLLRRLVEQRKTTARGHASWEPPAGTPTLFHGYGHGSRQECTALVVQALRRARANLDLALQGAEYLLSTRSTDGGWATTRATVLALQALLLSRPAKAVHPRRVDVYLGGRLQGALTLAPGSQAVTHTLDLSAGLGAGTHRVRLVPVGGGNALYRVALRFHEVARERRAGSGLPRLSVRYSSRRLFTGQVVRVTTELRNPTKAVLLAPMIELGLPPGFELLEEDLRQLLSQGAIDRYERRHGRLLLYLTRMAPGKLCFTYRLRSRYPLKVRIPGSRFYEYYRPERVALAPARTIEVVTPRPSRAGLAGLLPPGT